MDFKKSPNILKNESIEKVKESSTYKELQELHVSPSLNHNTTFLKNLFKDSHDVIFRDFLLESFQINVTLVYIKGMTNKETLDDGLLKQIKGDNNYSDNDKEASLSLIKSNILTISEVKESTCFKDLILNLLSGNILMFIDGFVEALVIDSRNPEMRSISEPKSERTVKGPQEGFVENIETNITMIRRRIKDPNLAVEYLKVGRRTQTDIAVIYLKDVVRKDLPEEIKSRIQKPDVDGILGSAPLEQLIERNKWTIAPQTMATERPDKASAHILEGRVVIIVDGTPFVSILPTTFAVFFNSPDEHYERSIIGSTLRFIRYLSYFIATTLPAAYIALTTFHPGMIPTSLALSITGSRAGVPFPIILEILIMELILYILQEAAIRLPSLMGQTIGIVGGLVIGQSAVEAGIISPIIVIIVSLTAISSFSIPVYTVTLSIRLVRTILIFCATVLGLYGISMAWSFFIIHMASLKDFGVRYLGDFSPYNFETVKGTFLKVPKGYRFDRPEALETQDIKRQKKDG